MIAIIEEHTFAILAGQLHGLLTRLLSIADRGIKLMLKETVPLLVRLCTLFVFTLVGAIVGELVIEWIGIWSKKSFGEVMLFVSWFATPQVVILSSIKAKVPLLTALGMYCFLSIFTISLLYGYSYSGTASLVYFALYIFGIPIAILIYIFSELYDKKANTKVDDS